MDTETNIYVQHSDTSHRHTNEMHYAFNEKQEFKKEQKLLQNSTHYRCLNL